MTEILQDDLLKRTLFKFTAILKPWQLITTGFLTYILFFLRVMSLTKYCLLKGITNNEVQKKSMISLKEIGINDKTENYNSKVKMFVFTVILAYSIVCYISPCKFLTWLKTGRAKHILIRYWGKLVNPHSWGTP
jgi:hypothetical protein